jgi:hypothetical protein
MTTTFVVSPTAPGGGTGSDANPFTLNEAIAHMGADTDLLFNAGTYLVTGPKNLTVGGSSVAHLCRFLARTPGTAIFKDNNGSSSHQPFFKLLPDSSGGACNYFVCQGFEFDGNAYNSNMAFQVQTGRHHVQFLDNYLHHLGGNGYGFERADYVTVARNYIWLCGHPSRTDGSGISINSEGVDTFFDSYDGFHNILALNVIAGCEGEPSDGNGIILDNGSSATEFVLGSTLVVGNVAYMNGNRAFHHFRIKPHAAASGVHLWICNTSYMNGLDTLTASAGSGFLAEFSQDKGEAWWMNNYARATNPAGVQGGTTAFRDAAVGTSRIHSYGNRYTGGKTSSKWSTLTSGTLPLGLTDANLTGPLPTIDTSAAQGHLLAPDPRTTFPVFVPQSISPLRDSGVDPLTLSFLTDNMKSDLAPYLGVDIAGSVRPS